MSNKCIKRNEKIFFLLFVCIIFISISFFILTPFLAKKKEVYFDIIVEELMKSGFNKTYEIHLFYFLIILSTFICIFLDKKYFIFSKKNSDSLFIKDKFTYFIGIPIIVSFIFYGKIDLRILFLYIFYLIFSKVNINISKKIFILSNLLYYCVISILQTILFFKPMFHVNRTLIDFLFIIISLFINVYSINENNFKKIKKYILKSQVMTPLLLLKFLTNTYSLNGEIIIIDMNKIYKYIIIFLIIILFFLNVKNLFHNNKEVVFVSTIISIMVFHNCSYNGMIVPIDWHHDGEIMVPYQQIIEKGQELYSEFFPASGLFHFAISFLQENLFGAKLTSYYLANTTFTIIYSIVITYGMYYLIGSEMSLYFVIFTMFQTHYNRVFLIVPIILLFIFSNKLKKNNLVWLILWFLITLLSGLYYPLYGVSTFVATTPYLFFMIYKYHKEVIEKKYYKKIYFYLIWIVMLYILIYFSPLLYKIYKHMKIYSSQSILADSISIFNQNMPDYIMPYIKDINFRKIIYYSIRHLIPILLVVFINYNLYLIFLKHQLKKIIGFNIFRDKVNRNMIFLLLAGNSILLISYKFTILRMDSTILMARSSHIVYIVISTLILPFMIRYSQILYNRNTKYILISIFISILVIIEPPANDYDKLIGIRYLSEDMSKIDYNLKKYIPKLGDGFISNSDRNELIRINKIYNNKDYKKYKILNLSNQMSYYALNLKAAATGTSFVSKSKESQKEIIDILKKDDILLYEIDTNNYFTQYFSISNYYLYYYLMEKNYILADGIYMEPNIAKRNKAKESDISKKNYVFCDKSLGYICSSLGKSINKLMPSFNIKDINLKIAELNQITHNNNVFKLNFSENRDPYILFEFENEYVQGKESDFLYLKLYTNEDNFNDGRIKSYFQGYSNKENRLIKIYWRPKNEEWSENYQISLLYGNGELLIPLGAFPGWLLSDNIQLRLDFEDGFDNGTELYIQEYKFLKLNQD